MYTAGPFLLGSLFFDTLTIQSGLYIFGMFLYFVLPANVLMYGVNDYFDWDTDQLNPKKETKEIRVSLQQRVLLKNGVVGAIFISVIVLFLQPSWVSMFWLLAFLIGAIAYSTPPVRLKSRPFLDSLSNMFYIFPGFVAFGAATGSFPPLLVGIIGGSWTAAMHLYSAIPDIVYDKQAGLNTTATKLGFTKSNMACSGLWMISAVGTLFLIGLRLTTILVWVYPVIPLVHLFMQSSKAPRNSFFQIEKMYWLFPYITTMIGAVATIEFLLQLG